VGGEMEGRGRWWVGEWEVGGGVDEWVSG